MKAWFLARSGRGAESSRGVAERQVRAGTTRSVGAARDESGEERSRRTLGRSGQERGSADRDGAREGVAEVGTGERQH